MGPADEEAAGPLRGEHAGPLRGEHARPLRGEHVGLLDEVRSSCRAIAKSARHVTIDLDAARPPAEAGRSGYFTVAWALADRFRAAGPWSNTELRALEADELAAVLGQEPGHPLMRLYAQALRDLGRFLGGRTALDLVAEADGSAERLATALARGMRFFDDRGFYKRAQIVASDLALGGLARFHDLDRLTIFADNLVPHVLRVDGVLRYDPELAAHIDAERLLPPGEAEREIRACAVHACEQIAERTGIPPRLLDVRLWNRGQAPEYKRIPRHRTRSVYY